MTLPSLLFGILVSTLYGALFHFIRGGGAGRLSLYLLLSWSGFWAGHLLGRQLNWTFVSVGPLNLGMASFGSVIFIGIGYWLSLVKTERKSK